MSQVAKIEERQLTPSQQFRAELDKMGDQFAAALPSHIKPEKFQRVVMTAVISDPAVLKADRKSLMEAAIRAAQDGLLPDKREGAFVVFGNIVQWMPMVGGIIKRVHQSGDIKMLTARVVYGGDHFRTWIDDTGEHIEYEPAEDQDQNVIRRVFAMATTVDGAVYVEPLSAKDIEKIRNVSRSKNKGPWADWWEEMAKKSAIRRLAKRLPLSVDIHDLIQRDNAFYDIGQEPESKPTLSDRLKAARNITPELDDKREGFDRSFVQSETETALTGEILTKDNESGTPSPDADESSSPSSSAGATENPSSVAPSHTDTTDTRGGSVSDSAASGDGSAPLPSPEAPTLIDCAREMLSLTVMSYSDDDERNEAIRQCADEWKAKLPDEQKKIDSIFVSAMAVASTKRTLIQARKFLADVLECSIEDLEG